MGSGNRYTEEFKIEAVKQVTERGRPLGEVAERLGVSPWSQLALEEALCNAADRARRSGRPVR